MTEPLFIHGAGAVLGDGPLQGDALIRAVRDRAEFASDGDFLEGFDPKPYIQTVKGYLDDAGKYALAAASLAVDEARQSLTEQGARVGVASATRWGAPASGFRFCQQLAQKGLRFASPLVFPHSYSNTAGNLVAMEFRFGGPHMVYFGRGGALEALRFAAAELRKDDAETVLVVASEAATAPAIPDETRSLNGAVALRFSTKEDGALGRFDLPTNDNGLPAFENGAVDELLGLTRELSRPLP